MRFAFGVSTSILNRKKDTVIDAVKFAVEYRFDAVEIVCESPDMSPKHTSAELIREIKEVADTGEVRIQLHAPFYSINIASFDEEFLRFSLDQLEATLKLAYKLEAPLITVHIGLCFLPCQFDREGALRRAANSLKKLLTIADDYGIKLAVENRGGKLDLGKPEDLLILDELLGRPENLGFTFDVVQANTIGDPIEQFRMLAKRVINSHIRDAPRGKEALLAVGEGEIDFESLVREFIKVGFRGPLIFEVSSRERAIISRVEIEEIANKVSHS